MTVTELGNTQSGAEHCAMYNSPYMAEFYDLLLEDHFASSQDYQVYSTQLQSVCDQRPHPSQITVLDIATGTGRIIRGLIDRKEKQDGDRNMRFIGLDISQDMLNRAARTTLPSSDTETVSWVLGSAIDLETALAAEVPSQSVDLITLAFGSISHFHEDGQPERFFQQVAQLLRRGEGRAAVSFVSLYMDPDGPVTMPIGAEGTPNLPSRQFPGVFYQEAMLDSPTEGRVFVDRRQVTVTREDDSGHRQVLAQDEVATKFRLFAQQEVRKMIAAAGLRVVDIITIPEEQIWVMQHQ